ncbi:MAG: hypothetical protein Q9215_007070 [Flavoplaca cf. flavocitrina]
MDTQSTDGLVITNHQSRGRPGLPNQGQIDWVALANTTVSASVGFLSRMSGAGVDPFTVAVGQAVASKFQMSRLGIHRLESAVNNLRHASMMGDALWFGFGINHIIRSLMHTNEGATCVMLCSILSESRTSVLSARVLFELTTTYSSSSPDTTRLTPSLQQWEALVKACAGTLSATPFGTVVDQMVMLVSQHRTSNPRNGHSRHVGDPESVAAVLNALSRLSMGHLVTLTISGGSDCGWIAAVVYWFFDIAVEIRDVDGQVVYPLDNRPDASRRTLVVVQTLEQSTALQATSEAYTVADITRDIMARDQAPDELSFNLNDLQTRVSWQSVLRQTFGRQASALLRLKVDLGTAVGSAARIFLEYAKPQLDESLSLPGFCWYGHGAASYGQGFLHFICMTFPEMASLREIMEIALQKSYLDAVSAYQSIHERLRSTCECKQCGGKVKRLTPGVRGQNLCLSILCGFVMQLALDLSVTFVPPSLLPTRSGLEISFRIYSDNNLKYSKEDAPLVSNAFMKAWNLISVLFTGYEEITSIGSPGRETLAFVKGGLCFYLGVLAKLSDKPEEMYHTFIIPGCIETKTGRIYDALNSTPRFNDPAFTYDASPALPCVENPTMPGSAQSKYEVSAVVEETMINLTLHFIVRKSLSMSVACSPWLLLSKLQQACGTNRISCSRQGCPELDIAGLSIATIRGEGRFEDEFLEKLGCKIGLRLVDNNPISRLLALLVDQTYRKNVSTETTSRSRRNIGDGWLDYGSPDVSPMESGRDGYAQDNLEDEELHAVDEVDDGNSSPPSPYIRESDLILQRDECLPCAIRKAVTITGRDFHNVYIICLGGQCGLVA